MVFWPSKSLLVGKKVSRGFCIWNWGRAQFSSFGAFKIKKMVDIFHSFSSDATFHSASSPIFIAGLLLQHLFSFRAVSYNTYFHSLRLLLQHLFSFPSPSPTTPIFFPLLLVHHLFSFRAFSYNTYFHSAPSPTALILILRILLQHLLSLFECDC